LTTKDKNISFETDFTDYQINAEDAMRLGLIVNELVTNSVKHAFHDVHNPTITIATALDSDSKLTLKYAVNGPKVTPNIATNEPSTSLGLNRS